MKIKAPIYRIVFVQLALTIIAALLLLFIDVVKAYSVLLGGLTCVLPNFFMAWRMGRESANPGTALKYLVRGELGKLAITALLFALVFKWVVPLEAAYFFVALVCIMLGNIFVPLVEAQQAKNKIVDL